MFANARFTIGLPKIHAEPGEKRAFLPHTVSRLANRGAALVLEEGYGASLGFNAQTYLESGQGKVSFGSLEDVYRQDCILVLRCPLEEHLSMLKPGSTLISMLHFPTRPERVALLNELRVEAVSLDSIKDDSGRRLVENLRAVGWNGIETAIHVLKNLNPNFENPSRGPLHVTLLGPGAVGIHALQAATRYADDELRRRLYKSNVPGVVVRAVDFDTTGFFNIMVELLRNTDILVDATQRPDPSKPVIPNEWLAYLPKNSVLLDLSVDPYNCGINPISVKGIEGIPEGNLDQYVFAPADPAFENIPDCVDTTNRRWSVSCYSWPGIHPIECMELYGRQMMPLLNRIIDARGAKNINPNGRYFERAIGRALLSRWLTENHSSN